MQIDAEPLTGWGSPELIEQAAADLRSAAQAVSTHATAAHEAWSALREHYEGPEQETVYAGMDAPKAIAADVADRGHQAAVALEQFASDLRDLEPRRSALVEDIAAFNESDGTEEEIHFGPGPDAEDQRSLHQTSLEDEISGLQSQYDLAVQVCVDRLNAIGVVPRGDGDPFSGYNAGAALWSTAWSSAPDVLTHTETVEERRTRWARYQRVFDVSSDGSAEATYPFPVDEGSSTSRSSHRGFSLFGTSTAGGMSQWWDRHSTGRDTAAGSTPPSRRPSSTGGLSQNLANNLPVVGAYRAFRGEGPGSTPPRPTPASRFSSSYADGGKTRVDTHTRVSSQTTPTQAGKVIAGGAKSLSVAGIAVSAVTTYHEEKAQHRERIAADHPDWTPEEVEDEAVQDALANTTGQVATEVVAEAVVIGGVSLIPGVGPVLALTLGTGLSYASGWAVHHEFMDDQDDDGDKDSVAGRSGQFVQDSWDQWRGAPDEEGSR